jgi:hypothetical protein
MKPSPIGLNPLAAPLTIGNATGATVATTPTGATRPTVAAVPTAATTPTGATGRKAATAATGATARRDHRGAGRRNKTLSWSDAQQDTLNQLRQRLAAAGQLVTEGQVIDAALRAAHANPAALRIEESP